MNKIYTLAALVVMTALPSFSQQYRLIGMDASDGMDYTEYEYDDENKLTEIRRYDLKRPENNHIIVIEYDEQGREIKNSLYQDKDKIASDDIKDYRASYYIDYFYGEDGRLKERINYNNLASGFNEPIWAMGGVMVYEYDVDGNVVWVKTYFDVEQTSLFQDVENIYEDGRLMKSVTRMSDFMGGMDVSSIDEYHYTESGQIESKDLYRLNMGTWEMDYTGAEEYSYDEKGNLVMLQTTGPDDSIVAKNTYAYPSESVPASQVVFPYEIEETDFNQIWSIFKEKPLSYDKYGFDEVAGGMSVMVTYTYVYDEVSVGIDSAVAGKNPSGVSVATFTDGILVLDGVETGSLVRVFSVDGKHICDRKYSQRGVDLSSLASGVYYVSAGNGAVKVGR